MTKIKKARTLADIQNHPMVESTHTEYDGYREDDRAARWVYLKEGFISPDMECGTIHEGTIKECCEKLNSCRAMTPAERKAHGLDCDVCGEQLQDNFHADGVCGTCHDLAINRVG